MQRYVGNSPTNGIDPDGLDELQAFYRQFPLSSGPDRNLQPITEEEIRTLEELFTRTDDESLNEYLGWT